ncbi:serine-threonine protein kinase, putative [Bodo saltans]|uniref:non-specific serine/threonine protein kinase n=1 Tax=Bodo saltans TaxID=75058 RepID=A0A0S4IVS5_BODSA|nr:serine-threonine protein kinase, putative [Bodo saltans]|eukprot:CUG05460.1 serine-threonine protein kinase, putative [Bodo saltans]
MAEVRVMQSLPHHPSLLSLEEVLQTRTAVTMIVEYSAEGTLRDALYGSDANGNHSTTRKVHQGFSEENVVRYLTQLVNALGYMHQHEVLHRDIKLENLLLFSQKSVVKVSDFGVATILGRTTTGHERMAQTTAGTPHYMSPEVCEGHPYGYKSDIWSLGVVAYEMCTTAVPFQASNMLALSGKICHQATPDLPQEYSRRLDAIIKAMLTKNQSTRPSIKDVTAMLQYYRRKKAEHAPDGRDIGGFAVDSHITPNDLFDDMTDEQEGGAHQHNNGPTQSWGAPSLGIPDDDWGASEGYGEDPLAGFDDGTRSHQGGAVTPQPRQDTTSGSVFASSVVLEATRNSEPDPHVFSVKQVVTDHPRTGGQVTAQQRSAIFLEARRQAAENKRNAEHELQRVQHDNDEEAGKASRTPRLRTLVEEMQEELRKQTQNVDAMMARYGTGRYDHINEHDDELPHENHLQKPQRSTTPPPHAKPFVDPAANTPSAVRKSISPNRPRGSGIDESASPLYSPREAVDSPVSPKHHGTSHKEGKHPTPPHSSHGVAHHPPLPAKRNSRDGGGKSPPPPAHIHLAAASAHHGAAKPTPQSTPRVQPIITKPPTPASKPHSATTSPASNKVPRIVVRNATLVNHDANNNASFDASMSGKEQLATYYPPCAHCMKSAKEKRQTVAATPPTPDQHEPIFLTIHPSRYYCSTCHAPLCETCHLTVHDPMTTTTNLSASPLGGGGAASGNMSGSTLSATLKRHNVFYLTVSDPSTSSAAGSPPSALSGPAGRVSPTQQHGHHLQTLEAEKKSSAAAATTTCGCTIM